MRRTQIADVTEGGRLCQGVPFQLGDFQRLAVRVQRLVDSALLAVHDAQSELEGRDEALATATRNPFQPGAKVFFRRPKLALIERCQPGVEVRGGRHNRTQRPLVFLGRRPVAVGVVLDLRGSERIRRVGGAGRFGQLQIRVELRRHGLVQQAPRGVHDSKTRRGWRNIALV